MAKSRSNKFIDTIDECLTNGVKNGIFQVSLEDDALNGRTVTIDDHSVVNFGSCSYLGLEVDERLKQGAIDATLRYGTQYSSSRLFSSCNLYEELEDLFYNIFDNHPSILAATTTLTHVSAIPILVQDDDLVILDHQVHGSVQLAVQLVKARGTEVAMIKHNRMDMLEDLIKSNPNKYNKIWYMADGLYSMYGDYAPMKDIVYMLDKYFNFHVYIDDAHGMSWTGKHGNGYVLSQVPLHPKMALSTSLAKGFGTGGGVLILSDPEMRRKILTCGSSYTFSGPVQPPMLGASIASAKIHLSDEIYTLQNQLKIKLELTQKIIEKYQLPLVLPSDSPIFYIGLGLPRVGYNMVRRLLKDGFYTNIGIFPGVPVKCCGLRLAVTNGQTAEDIENVLSAFAYHFSKVLEEEGLTVDDISTNFNIPFEDTKLRYKIRKKDSVENGFKIQHETSILKIDSDCWNTLLGDEGTFDWEGCKFIENSFKDNPEPENNWNLHYLIIKDENETPILATFFTELICKDDMISPAIVSEQIEKIRKDDHYYLSSKVIMMGSLLSEGNHLFLRRDHPKWKNALLEMIRIMNEVKQNCGATTIHLRDIDSDDTEIRDFLITEGFIKAEMPDTHIVEDLSWSTDEEFLNTISYRSRKHVRKFIFKNQPAFDISFVKNADHAYLEECYNLYLNVKKQSFILNTFDLPKKLFRNVFDDPNWEVMLLKVGSSKALGCFVFSYKSMKNNYCPFVIGLDYEYNSTFSCYRQALFQLLKRATKLKANKVYLGMAASIEKQKMGVKVIQKSVYIQANNNYNMAVISLLKQN